MRHQTIIRCVIKIQLLRIFGFMYCNTCNTCNTESNFSAFILFTIMRDDKSVTSFWKMRLQVRLLFCVGTHSDLAFFRIYFIKVGDT